MKTIYKKISYSFEQLGNVSVFSLRGRLNVGHGEELRVLLMRAVHGIDRAVFNLRNVTEIDEFCLDMFREAYCSSLELRNPIILTEVPKSYREDIYRCSLYAGDRGSTPEYRGSYL